MRRSRAAGEACNVPSAWGWPWDAAAHRAVTVQLFGVVDASIEYAKGSESVVRMREGQQAASRWGSARHRGSGRRHQGQLPGRIGLQYRHRRRVLRQWPPVRPPVVDGTVQRDVGRVPAGPPVHAIVLRAAAAGPVPAQRHGVAVQPAQRHGVAGARARWPMARFDNAVQYFSPTWGGFSFGAAVAPGKCPGPRAPARTSA